MDPSDEEISLPTGRNYTCKRSCQQRDVLIIQTKVILEELKKKRNFTFSSVNKSLLIFQQKKFKGSSREN
jgi:hypothetical protein